MRYYELVENFLNHRKNVNGVRPGFLRSDVTQATGFKTDFRSQHFTHRLLFRQLVLILSSHTNDQRKGI